MANFDLKKFLIENKLTSNSKALTKISEELGTAPYRKIVRFDLSRHDQIDYVGEVENKNSFLDFLGEDDLNRFKEYISSSDRDYSIEEIKEGILNRDEEFVEVGKDIDEFSDEDILLLGVKSNEGDVNKWLEDNWFQGEREVEDYKNLSSDSKALSEQPSRDKVTSTEWNIVNGKYQPTITFKGKQYTLEFDDQVRGDDSGTVIQTYFTDELPGYEFEVMAAYQGVHYPADPTYYYDGQDWEVIEP